MKEHVGVAQDPGSVFQSAFSRKAAFRHNSHTESYIHAAGIFEVAKAANSTTRSHGQRFSLMQKLLS